MQLQLFSGYKKNAIDSSARMLKLVTLYKSVIVHMIQMTMVDDPHPIDVIKCVAKDRLDFYECNGIKTSILLAKTRWNCISYEEHLDVGSQCSADF